MFLKSPPALVLASTSPYRRQLLARLGIPFDCRPPGVDEAAQPGEEAPALVTRLALAKAQAVSVQRPGAWIVGSDQVALLTGGPQLPVILGKPGSPANCAEQLRLCSGRTLTFLTGVAVIGHVDSAPAQFMDTTRVTFRKFDAATIARYVERESPLDCAGAFKSEGLGITLCESIDSADPTALIGLPLIRLCEILRGGGFDLP